MVGVHLPMALLLLLTVVGCSTATAYLLLSGESPQRKEVMVLDAALVSLTGSVALTADTISDLEIVCASAARSVTITATTIRRVTLRSAPGCVIGIGGLTVSASHTEDLLVYINSSEASTVNGPVQVVLKEAKNVALRGDDGKWGSWGVGSPSCSEATFFSSGNGRSFGIMKHILLHYGVPELTGVPLIPATAPLQTLTFWSKVFCDVLTGDHSPTTDTFVVSGPVLTTLLRSVRAASIGPGDYNLSGYNKSTALTLGVGVPPPSTDTMRFDVAVSGESSATFTYAEIVAAARAWYSSLETTTIVVVLGDWAPPLLRKTQPLLLPPATVDEIKKEAES
jgi:hypothetical protein